MTAAVVAFLLVAAGTAVALRHRHRWLAVSVSTTKPGANILMQPDEYSHGRTLVVERCAAPGCAALRTTKLLGVHDGILRAVAREELRHDMERGA